MNHFDSAFASRLSKYIAEIVKARQSDLVVGIPQSFESYRERVGYLRAMIEVSERMEEIERDLQKGE